MTVSNRMENGCWTVVLAIRLNQLIPDKEDILGRRFYMHAMRTRRYPGGVSSSWSILESMDYSASFHRMGKIYLR